jgi:hypothetical protein
MLLAAMRLTFRCGRPSTAGALAFNDFPEDAEPSHRDRMQLILTTPALQAHSVLRYGEWRVEIASYVAVRLGFYVDDILPRTVGQVSHTGALGI